MTNLIVTAARLINHITPFTVDIRGDVVDLMSVPHSKFTFSHIWDSEPDAKETFQFVNTRNGNHDVDLPQAALLYMKELDLEDIERFICVMHRDLSKEWWRTMLDRASDLRGLYTERLQNPGALMRALTPDSTDDHEPDPEPSVFLPSLNLVSFANTVFARSPSRCRSTSTSNTSYEEGSLMHLIDCLRLRKEHKHRLDLLQLPGTEHDHREFSTLLRRYIDTVFYLGDKDVDDALYDSGDSDYEQGPQTYDS